jgi:hypothetical protein
VRQRPYSGAKPDRPKQWVTSALRWATSPLATRANRSICALSRRFQLASRPMQIDGYRVSRLGILAPCGRRGLGDWFASHGTYLDSARYRLIRPCADNRHYRRTGKGRAPPEIRSEQPHRQTRRQTRPLRKRANPRHRPRPGQPAPARRSATWFAASSVDCDGDPRAVPSPRCWRRLGRM